MRRSFITTAAIGAAMIAVAPLAAADSSLPNKPATDSGFAFAPMKTGLRICISGDPEQGTGRFAVEGVDRTDQPNYVLTPILNPGGDADGDDSDICHDIAAGPGNYRITPGKYLSALCLVRDANDPTSPELDGDGNPTLAIAEPPTRCLAKVHHWHTQHDIFGTPSGLSTLEVPWLVVNVKPNEVTKVSAHVVDAVYPECTEGSNPSPDRVCNEEAPAAP